MFHNYIELQQHASCMGLTRWWMDSFIRASPMIVIGCKCHSIWSALLCKEISYCLHGLYGCLKVFYGILGGRLSWLQWQSLCFNGFCDFLMNVCLLLGAPFVFHDLIFGSVHKLSCNWDMSISLWWRFKLVRPCNLVDVYWILKNLLPQSWG